MLSALLLENKRSKLEEKDSPDGGKEEDAGEGKAGDDVTRKAEPSDAKSESGSASNAAAAKDDDPNTPQPRVVDDIERAIFTFPERLMELLDQGAAEDAMWWLEDGDGFCVNPKLFGDKVLNKFFQGTKFESFTRKLNRWGFKRASGQHIPINTIAYYHNLFQRGKPELLKNMRGGKKKDLVGKDKLVPNALNDFQLVGFPGAFQAGLGAQGFGNPFMAGSAGFGGLAGSNAFANPGLFAPQFGAINPLDQFNDELRLQTYLASQQQAELAMQQQQLAQQQRMMAGGGEGFGANDQAALTELRRRAVMNSMLSNSLPQFNSFGSQDATVPAGFQQNQQGGNSGQAAYDPNLLQMLLQRQQQQQQGSGMDGSDR